MRRDMGVSTADFIAMQVRLEKNKPAPPPPADAELIEGDLHDKIIAYCIEHRWGYIHSRMDRKTTTGVGVCDFVIAASGGRAFWIECKSRDGKMKTEQLAFKLLAEMNGHEVYVIRSMSQFLNLITETTP